MKKVPKNPTQQITTAGYERACANWRCLSGILMVVKSHGFFTLLAGVFAKVGNAQSLQELMGLHKASLAAEKKDCCAE